MSKKVPQIRFNGYSDAWVQRKLGQLFNQEVQYIDPKAENIPLWSLTVADGLVEKTDRYNREFLVKKNDKFKLVKDNWFTYNPMNMTLGALDVNELGQDIAVSGYYVTMSLDNQFNRTFLKTWMKSDKAIGLFKLYATGSLIEKQRVQFGTLSEIPSKFPEYEEQTQIGQFFDSLDNLIAANQRKLDLLKEQKKGYLQKMFPKNGSKFPQLRFAGFADAWEERKFGELYKKVNEKNDLSFGKDRVISVANMYFKDTGNIRSDDAYMKTYNIFRTGDIAFEGNRSKHFSYGRFVENTIGDGIVSHVFDVFRPIQQFDLNYWKYAIHNERVMGPILMTATTSSTMMTNLVAKDFLKRAILVPSYSEQKLVGSFFKQLDDTIALHQRELDLLKEQKKGYLQKMFC
ncbi:restriction endonuclease subunit S [Lactiplantibacillus plantarum]|uniref:restriction endonuclease subunit S n=1 Tax=Lactiplantibacillus plantarum TaxID=1590 RepID=UPI0003507979|nr:restriction endonuclease subunit S [Lactiplantibacillus plantarum]AGO06762.1 type I restriction-modification system,specificity subunit [Lactiplantibacillus plantarum 16]MBO2717265.1 restriction endonuclease subunit S [Lactiplantibacillus plantarum]